MAIDREFLMQLEDYYLESEPEFRLIEQKVGTLPAPIRARHESKLDTLGIARQRFLKKLEYLRKFEALEEHLTHATRLELMKSWLEYRAKLSEMESVISEERRPSAR